jgi:hypothetical protein
MKVKKIAIVLLVIVAGLMLGVTFSSLLSPQNNSSTTNNSGKTEGFKATLSADPTTIQSVTDTSNLGEKDKKEQSVLSIAYTNNTLSDLTGVEIWVSGTGANFGFSGSKNASYDQDTKQSGKKYSVFNAASVKRGETQVVQLYLFSRVPDNITVNVELKTKEGINLKLSPVNITAN